MVRLRRYRLRPWALGDGDVVGDLFDWEPPAPPKPAPEKAFDGETYEAERDYFRLDGQLGRVFHLMKDGKWRTIPDIVEDTGGSPQSVSARLRDFRKRKYGSHIVERKSLGGGLFTYRLTVCPTSAS